MASNISILTTPAAMSPVYNSLEICVKENDAASLAMAGYKFVIDIETETLGTTRYLVAPEPVLSLGFKDAGQVLEGFIVERIAQFNSAASFVFGQDRPIIKYRFNVFSGWNVAGVFTVDPDGVGAVSTAFIYAWSASFGYHDWVDQFNAANPFNTWLCNTANGSNAELLTTYKTPKVSINDLGWTYLLTDVPTDAKLLEIKTFDSAGALIQTAQSVNAVGTSITAARLWSIATSPQSLNNIGPALLLGSQPIITASVATYTIEIQNAAFNPVSEILNFTIEEPCRYEIFRLQFLNKLGGIDSYNFSSRSVKSSTASRKSYTRGGTDITSGGIQYKHEDNGTVDYFIKSRNRIKLQSDYLTVAENDWLEELIQSPYVLLEFTDLSGVHNFKQVKVVTNDWVNRVLEIDKLFRLTINIELAHENFRQRR